MRTLLFLLFLTPFLMMPALAQPARPSSPTTARAALDRAHAAHSFGDMDEVVASSRLVVEGSLEATAPERAEGLRLFGAGLYLTGRTEGARAAFVELLRLDESARLDPATNRPDVVAFFQTLQAQHATGREEQARTRARERLLWSFVPPVGQFRNGDRGRGYALLGVAGLALGTAVTTHAILSVTRQDGNTHSIGGDSARTIKAVQQASVGLLAATYVVGVADALWRRNEPTLGLTLSWTPAPGGLAVNGRF